MHLQFIKFNWILFGKTILFCNNRRLSPAFAKVFDKYLWYLSHYYLLYSPITYRKSYYQQRKLKINNITSKKLYLYNCFYWKIFFICMLDVKLALAEWTVHFSLHIEFYFLFSLCNKCNCIVTDIDTMYTSIYYLLKA